MTDAADGDLEVTLLTSSTDGQNVSITVHVVGVPLLSFTTLEVCKLVPVLPAPGAGPEAFGPGVNGSGFVSANSTLFMSMARNRSSITACEGVAVGSPAGSDDDDTMTTRSSSSPCC